MEEQTKNHALTESLLNDGLDDAIRYWLCCGSKIHTHGAEACDEAKIGHPEHVRFGTAKEHSEWQKSLSSNV